MSRGQGKRRGSGGTRKQELELENILEELQEFEQALDQVIEDGFGPGQPYDPVIDDGVRVNIAPLQKASLLACKVLADKDVDRAIQDREKWRAEEKKWSGRALEHGGDQR